MKILIVGGGTGGHVMPAMVVAKELKKVSSRARVEFWTDRKNVNVVKKLAKDDEVSLTVKTAWSGKFRRYAGWSVADYFANWKITLTDLIFKNIGNAVMFFMGVMQSFVRLTPKETRPDVIFLKGGFVGLPCGIVAGWLKIPYIVHESDAAVGLANRILAKRAEKIAMGVPTEETEKGDGKKVFVGVPIKDTLKPITERRKKELKEALGFSADEPLVMVTGGSQGARTLNKVVRNEVEKWMKIANVGLVAGKKYFQEFQDMKELEKTGKFRMWDFCYQIDELLGAADVVISRAGATTIAELAAMKKAVILVPFEKLPGSHQVANAKNLAKQGAVEYILNEEASENSAKLTVMVESLIGDEEKREELEKNLAKMGNKDAGRKLAEMIMGIFYERKGRK